MTVAILAIHRPYGQCHPDYELSKEIDPNEI